MSAGNCQCNAGTEGETERQSDACAGRRDVPRARMKVTWAVVLAFDQHNVANRDPQFIQWNLLCKLDAVHLSVDPHKIGTQIRVTRMSLLH